MPLNAGHSGLMLYYTTVEGNVRNLCTHDILLFDYNKITIAHLFLVSCFFFCLLFGFLLKSEYLSVEHLSNIVNFILV